MEDSAQPKENQNADRVNVGNPERWASGALGVLVLAGAVSRRSLSWGIAACALLARGLTGHSALYAHLGINRAQRPTQKVEERDSVDQASWESFPASDPPSYTADTGVGGPH